MDDRIGRCATPGCEGIFVKHGRGRPREYCEECRPSSIAGPRIPKASLAVVAKVNTDSPGSFEASTNSSVEIGTLQAHTYAELVEAGRDKTSLGVAVLILAAAIDKGGHSAGSLAGLMKAHREAREAALERASTADDTLNQLARQRADRFTA